MDYENCNKYIFGFSVVLELKVENSTILSHFSMSKIGRTKPNFAFKAVVLI